MDWGRAKSVLIYSFLLLNLLLCYQLWVDLRDQASASMDFTSLSDATQQIMKQKDIRILSPIPANTPQLPDITYRYSAGEGDGTVKLDQPVDSKLIFTFSELSAALQDEIPDIGNFRFDSLESEGGVFVLHPLVDGKWPLFSVKLELIYDNQKIVAYRRPQIEIGENGEGKVQKVLPASKALGSLIEKFFPQGAAVKEIELGYYGELFNSENQVAAPMWRFMLEDGRTYYVNGISADIISPKTP
ncbi:YycH protein [compost metagenome]